MNPIDDDSQNGDSQNDGSQNGRAQNDGSQDGDRRGRELVPEGWRELDDTLADGPAPADVPPAAKTWLADQRFLHGLLRALYTPDVAAREGRIAGILGAIDRERTLRPRRHWLAVAAAALLMACLGVWMALPAALPTASAAVERAVAELGRDVVRRYRLVMSSSGEQGRPAARHEFELSTRPGGRFLVQGKLGFGQMQFGEVRIGSDGVETWLTGGNGMFRHAVPSAERERLLQQFGNVLDLGYLDVHDLVKKLPGDCELQVVGREVDGTGRSVLRIEARLRQGARRPGPHQAWLLCDEASGMITRLEVEGERPRAGAARMQLEYVGEVPTGSVEFGKPW